MFLKLFGNLVRKKDVYFQHSVSEQFTGQYWIDGKKIYQKIVTWVGLEAGKTVISLNTPNVENIIDYKIIAKSGVSSFFYKFPSVYYATGSAGTFYDTGSR